MNKVQERLVKAYAVLVVAKETDIKEVPETRIIGGVEYPIRSEVELEVARRTVASFNS